MLPSDKSYTSPNTTKKHRENGLFGKKTFWLSEVTNQFICQFGDVVKPPMLLLL